MLLFRSCACLGGRDDECNWYEYTEQYGHCGLVDHVQALYLKLMMTPDQQSAKRDQLTEVTWEMKPWEAFRSGIG